MRYRLILASASPRRLALLRQAGLHPEVLSSQVCETPLPDETPRAMVLRLARAKATAVLQQVPADSPPAVVLAADTVVVVNERVLGKPRDAREARSMLRALRGREHEVLTGVFLQRSDDGRCVSRAVSTKVRFRDFDEQTLRSYVATGEPLDKAGAYAIQGGGASLADSVDGSWNNVVGLPVEQLAAWLATIDVPVSELPGTEGA